MEQSRPALSPAWHVPAVFVLTCALASPFMSLTMPKASQLRAHGHADVALYFTVIAIALWFIALFVLLPRRRNTSGIVVVRALGRLPLLVRYALVFLVAMGLFCLGILYERIAA